MGTARAHSQELPGVGLLQGEVAGNRSPDKSLAVPATLSSAALDEAQRTHSARAAVAKLPPREPQGPSPIAVAIRGE